MPNKRQEKLKVLDRTLFCNGVDQIGVYERRAGNARQEIIRCIPKRMARVFKARRLGNRPYGGHLNSCSAPALDTVYE